MQLTGIHHLTAVSADAPGNLQFYTQVLGMRLVKKTVNQDDVSAYHLFYADGEARPGTDITFFDFQVPPERRGSHSIVRTALRVGGGGLAWWKERFTRAEIRHRDTATIDGRATLVVYDVTGARVRTLVDGAVQAGPHRLTWDGRNDQRQPVGSGVYFYRLSTGGKSLTKKMVLLK